LRRPAAFVAPLFVIAVFALAGALHTSLPLAFRALGAAAGVTLAATAATTAVALGVAILLGLLAGGISRSADIFLTRALELKCALPQPLIACSAFTFGGVTGAALLGVLRGIEVGHVLRLRIAEQQAAHDVEPPSLGRAPLSPYLRRVLPAAVGSAAMTLALSGAWLATLECAGARLGAPTAGSLATLAAADDGRALIAFLLVALLVATLCFLVRNVAPRQQAGETPGPLPVLALRRRIGAPRSGDSDAE
jgi:hypothetical protein